jgi:hypothetical protein
LIHLYIKCQKIGVTKEKFEKVYGFHEEYSLHREVQSVIFRWCRKTIRDIEDYCQQNYSLLPQIMPMNDTKIKTILTSTRGVNVRVKLLLLSLAFKKQEHPIISNGYKYYVTSWQLEPSRLKEVDRNMLVDLIKEINTFFEGKGSEE